MTPRQPTSFRLGPDERELIDAWAAHITAQTEVTASTSDVIRLLMRNSKPPEDLSPTARRIRTAYATLFRKDPA